MNMRYLRYIGPRYVNPERTQSGLIKLSSLYQQVLSSCISMIHYHSIPSMFIFQWVMYKVLIKLMLDTSLYHQVQAHISLHVLIRFNTWVSETQLYS